MFAGDIHYNFYRAMHGNILKFGWYRDGVALLRKPVISLKRGKIGPRLLLMTNRKIAYWLYFYFFTRFTIATNIIQKMTTLIMRLMA